MVGLNMGIMTNIKNLTKKLLNRKGFTVFKGGGGDLEGFFNNLYISEGKQTLYGDCYNIGAGSFSNKYWINVEKTSSWYKEGLTPGYIEHDLLVNKELPISNNSAKIVYASHVIEHVMDNNVEYYFEEIYRLLKDGGVFRIVCPDVRLALDAYRLNDLNFFSQWQPGIKNCFHGLVRFMSSQMLDSSENIRDVEEEFNRLLSDLGEDSACQFLVSKSSREIQQRNPSNHINWFTFDKLNMQLKNAGFNVVYKSAFGQSREAKLRDTRYFDNTYPHMSLYVEAIKHRYE